MSEREKERKSHIKLNTWMDKFVRTFVLALIVNEKRIETRQ